jgi:hypothetical protein
VSAGSLGSRGAPWYGQLLDSLIRHPDPASRSYRYMARLLEREFAGAGGHLLALTAIDGDAVAQEAALMLANCLQSELDAEVLIVDARLKSQGQGLSAQLGMLGKPGFAELLDGVGSLDVAACRLPTAVPRVSMLPCGAVPTAGALDRERIAVVLGECRTAHRWVLLLLDSLLADTRHLLLATQADAVFGVAVEDRTLRRDLDACDTLLRDNGAAGLRVVLAAGR